MLEQSIRCDILEIGRRLCDFGLVVATEGNISVRLDSDSVLATPTGISKRSMCRRDLVVVDMGGVKLKGVREVTSEIGMHLMIYRERPDVRAVVHAHPPTATGFAAAGTALDQCLLTEMVMGLGTVPLAPFAVPGTSEVAESLIPFVQHHNAILMANHGVVSFGSDLETAYMRMEQVEHLACSTLVAHLLGRAQQLSVTEKRKLMTAADNYGQAARMATAHGSGLLAAYLPIRRRSLRPLLSVRMRGLFAR